MSSDFKSGTYVDGDCDCPGVGTDCPGYADLTRVECRTAIDTCYNWNDGDSTSSPDNNSTNPRSDGIRNIVNMIVMGVTICITFILCT